MKRFKKIIMAVVLSCMLLLPFGATASAGDFSADNISGILKQFGVDLSDPNSIQNALDQFKNGGLSGLLGNIAGIDIGDLIAELEDYLFAFGTTTTTTQEAEATTEEPTEEETTETPTEEPATQAPTPPPTSKPSYQYTPPATLPPETTTAFQYIPPEQIYTEAYTTTVFNPIVDDDVQDSDVSPLKTIVGIILLAGSAVGVIVVAIALKRNRI